MCLFSSLFSIFLTIPLASDFDKRRWIALGIHVTHCLMIKGHFIIISFFFGGTSIISLITMFCLYYPLFFAQWLIALGPSPIAR